MSIGHRRRLMRLEGKAADQAREVTEVLVNARGSDGSPIKVFTLSLITGEKTWEYPARAISIAEGSPLA